MQRTIMRTIHTDTFSPKAEAVLKNLKTYMFDNWGSSQMERNAGLAEIEVEPNGEIIWRVYSHADAERKYRYGTYHYSRSTYSTRHDDQKVRDWLAASLKHVVYVEFKRSNLPESKNWKRTNKLVINSLSKPNEPVTVAEIYCLFDKLLNRKTFAKRWKKNMLDQVVGQERNAVATELELARREEIKNLEEKHNADAKKLVIDMYAEISRAQDEIHTKFRKLKEEELAAYMKAKEDLNKSLSFISEIPPEML